MFFSKLLIICVFCHLKLFRILIFEFRISNLVVARGRARYIPGVSGCYIELGFSLCSEIKSLRKEEIINNQE